MHLCIDGWPNDKSKIPAACLPFWTFRDEISFNDGVLFKGEKVIIPRAMQPEMLKLIYGSRLGIDKCKRQARDVLYWPGMASQIEKNCFIMCHLFHIPKTQPIRTFTPPQRARSTMGKSWC